MQPALRSSIPDAPLAVFPVNGENSHRGLAGRNPAPNQVREACKFTVLLAMRGQAEINRVGSRSPGKERDTESGLDYFGSRYYGSSMGRFMSPDWSEDPDPVPYADYENPQTLNLYGYVTNNPLRLYDPTGHSGCCDVLPSMAEVDAGIAYLEGGLETAATVSAGAVVGTVGLIGSQIFAPAQMGNDPAERRYLAMMSKGGRQNRSETDFAHYTDAELDALLKDPTTSASDREKIVREQKSRTTRNAQKRGGGKKKAPPVRNDPASVRARQQQANQAATVVPTTSGDNSTVTTTQEDHLPQPPKDPQQQ